VLIRDHGFTEQDAHAAALLADGSIGRALEGDSEAYAGAREAALSLLTTVAASADPRRRLAAARSLRGNREEREELARRLRLVSSMLRDLAILLARADDTLVANADLRSSLEGLTRAFDGERTVRAFSSVDRALDALARNAGPKIVADWVAFQI
jgi:hypothetical protein